MSRPPIIRAGFEALGSNEIAVDNFAGGGGASTGASRALGRPVDVAINHSPAAIAMHAVNHPETRHYCEDVFTVDPREVAGSRRVGFAWFSPDCTHFSKAKGGKPRDKKIRCLAWVVIRWARDVRPRVIALENVEEFEDWGPLGADGQPDPRRMGHTFRSWVGKLRSYGYEVDWRCLVAADYGAPTSRKRLFLIARCDGQPIVWPEPTHGPCRANPWRTAAEIVDWSLPCPSIFERARPLRPATLARVAEGVRRYVLDAPTPFIVPVTHHGDRRVHPLGEPLRTVTAANRGELALAVPTLIQTGYGERPGQTPRVPGLDKPLGTVVAGGAKHALVAALITKHYGGVIGHEVGRPIGTVTGKDHHALTAAFLTKFYGTSIGSEIGAPLPTVTAGGWHFAEVRTLLERFASREAQTDLFRQSPGFVEIGGDVYAIADIGMRMLQPRELFMAQGFPSETVIDFLIDGKPVTKTTQIDLCGNAVPPPWAEALTAANVVGPRAVAA